LLLEAEVKQGGSEAEAREVDSVDSVDLGEAVDLGVVTSAVTVEPEGKFYTFRML
jgi:hypothetical protein